MLLNEDENDTTGDNHNFGDNCNNSLLKLELILSYYFLKY